MSKDDLFTISLAEPMRDRVHAMSISSGVSMNEWIIQCIQASFDIYDSLPHPGDNPFHCDNLAVKNFFHAMEAKLTRKRRQGFGGWDDPSQCRVEFLSRKLREHVEKGDPIDVANFCMMLHQRGSAILPPDPVTEPVAYAASYQARVAAAHGPLFDGDPTDIAERLARHKEESNELCQALGMTREEAHQLVDYTWSRPVGEPKSEIGSTLLTLASLCVVANYNMMQCAEADLEKLTRPETVARIRAKRATRHGRGPLPGLSPDPASPE